MGHGLTWHIQDDLHELDALSPKEFQHERHSVPHISCACCQHQYLVNLNSDMQLTYTFAQHYT